MPSRRKELVGFFAAVLMLVAYETLARLSIDPRPFSLVILAGFIAICAFAGYRAGLASAALFVGYVAVVNFTTLSAAPARPNDGWPSIVFSSIFYFGTAIFIGIAQRKLWSARARAQLAQGAAQSEAELRSVIFDSALDAIIVIREDGRIQLWNASAERLFGWTAEEVLGKAVGETIVPPSLRDAHQAGLKRLVETGEGAILGKRLELRALRRDGTEFDVELAIVTYPGVSGQFYVGFLRDITTRKQSEAEVRELHEQLERRVEERTAALERANEDLKLEVAQRMRAEESVAASRQELQEYIDSMSTMNAKIAPDGRILMANRIGQIASGLTAEELSRSHFLEGQWWAFDPEVQQRVAAAFERAKAGESVNYDEKLFVFGRVLNVSFSLVPVKDESGQVQYLIAEARDITALKAAEDELRLRSAQLEAANSELESFSHSVSHDLRAPLRAIDGFSLALVEDYGDKLDDTATDYLKRVRAASQKMAQLIDDLLNLSRVSRSEMKRQRVSLSGLATSIMAELKRGEPDRKVEVKVTPGIVADGDQRLLRIAMQNLLDNAWKFTGKNGKPARIEFGQTQTEEGPAYYVKDNGAGFDMSYSDRLFNAFHRLHAESEFQGTGIGLATTARVVRRHGGKIWAEAGVGEGATFYFTL